MKLTKKAISIALALVMVVSVLAISTITSFADEKKYDDNIIISYDQYINDYGYGTGLTATYPRQLTFNKDGWMRIQSYEKTETPDANGNYLDGHFEQQWQYRGLATPEYDEQFHNALAAAVDNDMAFHIYMYVNSASLANPDNTYNNNAVVQLQCEFLVRWDSNGDGKLTADDEVIKLQGTPKSQVNSNFGFRYVDQAFLVDTVDEISDLNYRLEEIQIFVQNYDYEKSQKTNAKGQFFGLGNLDVAISPCFTKGLPGFDEEYTVLANNISKFDASTLLDMDGFTENIDGINPDDWTWDTTDMSDEEIAKTKYGKGRIKLDDNNYPLDKSGNVYTPNPVGTVQANLPKVSCTNLKATNITDTTVTLTWDASGDANYFHIRDVDNGINRKDAKTTTYTVKDLKPGTTYNFSVRAKNRSNTYGSYSNTITVTTTGGSAPTPPVTNPPVTNPPATNPPATVVPTTRATVATMNKNAKPVIKLAKGKKMITVTLKTKVANAKTYQIQYSTKKNFKGAKTKSLAASKKSLKIKSLKNKTKYFVRVRAVNGKTYSKWSKTMSVKTK